MRFANALHADACFAGFPLDLAISPFFYLIHYHDVLTNVFFSLENKDYLQQKIREEVLRKKNFGIGPQSDKRLSVVMESIFHEHARHLPYDIKGQIAELDHYVLDNVVPDVISNVEQKIGYIRDINKPIDPIELPKNVSVKGTKTLPSVDRFFPN